MSKIPAGYRKKGGTELFSRDALGRKQDFMLQEGILQDGDADAARKSSVAVLKRQGFTDIEILKLLGPPSSKPPTGTMMDVKAIELARKNGLTGRNVRVSSKLEWIDKNGEMVLRTHRVDPRTRQITIFEAAIEALYPRDVEAKSMEIMELAIRTLGNGQWDETEHPRADDGKFGSGPGSASAKPDSVNPGATEAPMPEFHPQVVPQDGDDWNKQLAIKLETEYQKAKPALDRLVTGGEGEEIESGGGEVDMDDAPVVPDHWEMMSDYQQEEVFEEWKSDNKNSFVENEINHWYESGGALDDAKNAVAYNFQSTSPDTEWAEEAIKEWKEERAENGLSEVPFKDVDLLDSLKISYEGNGEGSDDPDIEFDDAMLQAPAGYDPDQMTLPGMDPIDPSASLTEEMRTELKDKITAAFNKKAEDKSGDMEAPEYLSDSVDEYMSESWSGMSDDAKFEYATNNTDIINKLQQEYDQYADNADGESTTVSVPKNFDPLQAGGDSDDYKKTHALMTYMSRERGAQLLQQRGLVDSDRPVSDFRGDIRDIDNQLWRDWKSSSAGTFGGQMLQLATHEELGGRYREMPTHRDDLIKQADAKYKEIGGYNGIKALVRAKWETTQYALEKAGVNSMIVYRGLRIPGFEKEAVEEVETPRIPDPNYPEVSNSQIYERFTDAHLSRNGCYSTTTKRDVANTWSAGNGQKVVLRVDAPRTAVLSVPAYGINVHSEKEVVLAGTAFRGWDAWKNNAPSFADIPMTSSKPRQKEAA